MDKIFVKQSPVLLLVKLKTVFYILQITKVVAVPYTTVNQAVSYLLGTLDQVAFIPAFLLYCVG